MSRHTFHVVNGALVIKQHFDRQGFTRSHVMSGREALALREYLNSPEFLDQHRTAEITQGGGEQDDGR
jgi:hypothetical protein